jgi:hypothetical protein
MKNDVIRLVALLIPALAPAHVGAWSHANAYGGGTYHAPGSGSTTRTDYAGGSETHTYGQGTTATGRYGDTATHQEGSGQTTATNPYGGSATHTYGQGTSASNGYGGSAYHATGSGYTTYTSASGATAYHSAYYGAQYPAYHPPVTVNNYGSGCYNCGGWSTAGAAAAGAVVGVAAALRSPPPTQRRRPRMRTTPAWPPERQAARAMQVSRWGRSTQCCPQAVSRRACTARPTICAVIRGSNPRTAPTVFITASCQRRDTAGRSAAAKRLPPVHAESASIE